MLRRGQRGHQPNKSTPTRRRFEKKGIYDEKNAGIRHDPIDVDSVIRDNMDPEEYLTDVPWGRDPFAGDIIAAKKKVLFRPTIDQLDSLEHKIKHKRVNMRSGITGEVKVKHPKRFISKNSEPISITTNAIGNAPVQPEKPRLEKRGDVLEEQSGIRMNYREKVEVPKRGNRRTKQRSAIQEASEILGFIPVFSFQVASQNKKSSAKPKSQKAHVRVSDQSTNMRSMPDINPRTRQAQGTKPQYEQHAPSRRKSKPNKTPHTRRNEETNAYYNSVEPNANGEYIYKKSKRDKQFIPMQAEYYGEAEPEDLLW